MKNRNNNRGGGNGNKGGNFPQQTHFIGVLLPEDITLTLEDCGCMDKIILKRLLVAQNLKK
ncbi:hypothetical protein [Treponema sp.]|uniref:hypothetical protein n=1 Tax=Treponema sp. TaxID=166 RepID=UPI00388E746C